MSEQVKIYDDGGDAWYSLYELSPEQIDKGERSFVWLVKYPDYLTLQRERDELKKQRDELQAIVDKLPRTADGVVAYDHSKPYISPEGKQVHLITLGYEFICIDPETDSWDICPNQSWGVNVLYSTVEAKEAAKAAKGESK